MARRRCWPPWWRAATCRRSASACRTIRLSSPPRIRSASPNPDPTARKLHLVKAGESPSHGVRPTGCPFHPRCPYREPRCTVEEPELLEAGTENGESHLVACHLHRQLSLRTFAD